MANHGAHYRKQKDNMGGGASKSSFERAGKPGEQLPQEDVRLVAECLSKLPIVYTVEPDIVIEELSQTWEVFDVVKTSLIITNGCDGPGIYIILDGKVEILSPKFRSKHVTEIAELVRGESCGATTCIFKKVSTATCRAVRGARLLFISKASLRQYFNFDDVTCTLDEWLVRPMYLTTTGPEKAHVMKRVAVRALSKVPVFKDWGLISLQMLVDFMRTPIIICPNKSKILIQGDPSEALIVLLRGEMGIYDNGNLLTTVGHDHDYLPFWLGEEEMVLQDERSVTLRTHNVCQILIVDRYNIENVCEVRTGDAGIAWTQTLNRWEKHNDQKNPYLHNKYETKLKMETIVLSMKNSDYFRKGKMSKLWELAFEGKAREINAGENIMGSDDKDFRKSVAFMFVLIGHVQSHDKEFKDMEVQDNVEDYTEESVVSVTTLPDRCSLVAKQQTLLLEFPAKCSDFIFDENSEYQIEKDYI